MFPKTYIEGLSQVDRFTSFYETQYFQGFPSFTFLLSTQLFQHALNAQTYPPFLCIFMRFAVIFSRYIHNCRIYLHKYYVIIFIASRVRCRNGHYLIFVEHVNVSFVNKHFLSLTVIKIT